MERRSGNATIYCQLSLHWLRASPTSVAESIVAEGWQVGKYVTVGRVHFYEGCQVGSWASPFFSRGVRLVIFFEMCARCG